MKVVKTFLKFAFVFFIVFVFYTYIYHYQVGSAPRIDLKETFLASNESISNISGSNGDSSNPQPVPKGTSLSESTINKNGFYIRIDRIDLFKPVVKNVDPRYKEVYTKSWETGVSHGKFTALPDQIGNVYFFAHAINNANYIDDHNAWFTRIDELVENDEVIIYYEGKKYIYQVSRIYAVEPTATGVYTGVSPVPKMTMQTCGPPRGSISSRYMVEGLQKSVVDL